MDTFKIKDFVDNLIASDGGDGLSPNEARVLAAELALSWSRESDLRKQLGGLRQQLGDTHTVLRAATENGDRYLAELQRLQASRGKYNRRKARRMARDMVSDQ